MERTGNNISYCNCNDGGSEARNKFALGRSWTHIVDDDFYDRYQDI